MDKEIENINLEEKKEEDHLNLELKPLPSNSIWVSPTQVVPKKSGITVIKNENGDEIQTRLTTEIL
ncbi:unnamed protein product [Spirodela intermedia]|uniref:Uncharacterized protein n=1 Tax=Spirodela intermedia TaxID=51605 RepID=A0A7I8JTS5_SPIIN|nr:unnamed protein product [Spirodela intermedia]CAA6672852.1 unnamed protein product [Spirodela intermedia]